MQDIGSTIVENVRFKDVESIIKAILISKPLTCIMHVRGGGEPLFSIERMLLCLLSFLLF